MFDGSGRNAVWVGENIELVAAHQGDEGHAGSFGRAY
jgi:hypothetical protein